MKMLYQELTDKGTDAGKLTLDLAYSIILDPETGPVNRDKHNTL